MTSETEWMTVPPTTKKKKKEPRGKIRSKVGRREVAALLTSQYHEE